jgi:dTDP-4-dehydrorhamnose 3,5-epimerase
VPYSVRNGGLPGILVLEPRVFSDERGFFYESFNQRDFEAATNQTAVFVQDNQSRSVRGVLRGLHYQLEHPQGKLVRVTRGAVFDVAVDMRRSSATFGKWTGVELSESNGAQLWVPAGFAHGFLVVSEDADVCYKTTDYWYREHERSVRWNDPSIAIDWPIAAPPILAPRDAAAPLLVDAECYQQL